MIINRCKDCGSIIGKPIHKCKEPWNKGKVFLQMRGENNPAKRPEVREKLRILSMGELSNAKKLSARIKNSQWHKGKRLSPATEFKKGLIPWNKIGNGITSQIQKIRNSSEMQKWSRLIKERDNFKCQICEIRGGNLRSNHIKLFSEYPKLRFELTNGITICKDCDIKWVRRHEKEWESYFNFNLMTRGII
ncbi:MAG: hypothetical protein NUV97_03470 [archaeon]|nr:hypothetical protein [archaeon]